MTQILRNPFALRRIHSLAGLWFLLFLIEHLFTNSQAALWIGESGKGFIDAVNFIHNLPYLTVIEIALLGVPIATHALIGIRYALHAKMNSFPNDGTHPSLPKYGRNQAYSWQRITSYFLLFMLIFHVGKFRFYEYPKSISLGEAKHFLVKIHFDPGLYTVASRLNVTLFDEKTREEKIKTLTSDQEAQDMETAKKQFYNNNLNFDSKAAIVASEAQFNRFEVNYRKLLESFNLKKEGSLIADCQDFGTASIMSVRDTFKNKIYATLYTLFVLAAVFHGCNGFWTFCITWGLILRKAAQRAMVSFSLFMMFILGFLGLAAIWGTYFITLKN
jgi:succinate dehydrogenase / fumarate reductase, cytochrome b subunit